MLQPLDIAIILAYLIATIIIGLAVSKKARKSKEDYLLGAKACPGICWAFLTRRACSIFRARCG